MFEAKAALFLYAVSPVHMGAGIALGVIDSPIQREAHTRHPMFAGSGLKGALRHWLHGQNASQDGKQERWPKSVLDAVFGPDPGAGNPEHAGALAIGDAQLVCFPMRAVKRTFLYATSATALARMGRLLRTLAVPPPPDLGAGPAPGQAWAAGSEPIAEGGRIVLESYAYDAMPRNEVIAIGHWLAAHALPTDDTFKFFQDKIGSDLVVLPDEDFNFFVETATVVEPHVRINDVTGTADDGGLFYVENLPPESLLLAPVMASRDRRQQKDETPLGAQEILKRTRDALDNKVVQIGGDATIGCGQVVLRFANGG